MSEVFAVVFTETTHIEGDERSRQYPGHGYPAHSVDHQVFQSFPNYNDFEKWVKTETERKYGRRAFKAFKLIPIDVSV